MVAGTGVPVTEHLPAMVTPKWVDNPMQPIAIVNILHFLVAAARDPQDVRGVFDVGGDETITYRNMMERYALVVGLRRRIIVRVPLLSPRVSSMWVGFVTPVPALIARPLIDSLINKVLVDPAKSVLKALPPAPGGLLSFDEAVKRAIERTHAPTRWTDASRPWAAWDVAVTDPAWTGGSTGWYGFEWLWRLRGRTGRRNQHVLRVGDALDFWRIADVKEGETLLLCAEMRLPGQAWLEFRLSSKDGGTHVVQRAIFRPRGWLGVRIVGRSFRCMRLFSRGCCEMLSRRPKSHSV